jgi:hypothetical protein
MAHTGRTQPRQKRGRQWRGHRPTTRAAPDRRSCRTRPTSWTWIRRWLSAEPRKMRKLTLARFLGIGGSSVGGDPAGRARSGSPVVPSRDVVAQRQRGGDHLHRSVTTSDACEMIEAMRRGDSVGAAWRHGVCFIAIATAGVWGSPTRGFREGWGCAPDRIGSTISEPVAGLGSADEICGSTSPPSDPGGRWSGPVGPA